MDQDVALHLISEMLITAAMIAAPILIASLVIGLIISIIQVVTQIQEMTLTFVPKIVIAVVMVLVFGGWMLSVLQEYTRRIFELAAMLK